MKRVKVWFQDGGYFSHEKHRKGDPERHLEFPGPASIPHQSLEYNCRTCLRRSKSVLWSLTPEIISPTPQSGAFQVHTSTNIRRGMCGGQTKFNQLFLLIIPWMTTTPAISMCSRGGRYIDGSICWWWENRSSFPTLSPEHFPISNIFSFSKSVLVSSSKWGNLNNCNWNSAGKQTTSSRGDSLWVFVLSSSQRC